MAIIGNQEKPETWLNPDFPTMHEIRSAGLKPTKSGDVSYLELLYMMTSIRADERLVITRRALPSELETQIYDGVYRKKDPRARKVWYYGDRTRVRAPSGETRWTQEEAVQVKFNLHPQTKKAFTKAREETEWRKKHRLREMVWTGPHWMTDDGRPFYLPIIFALRGREEFKLIIDHPEKALEKFSDIPGIKEVYIYEKDQKLSPRVKRANHIKSYGERFINNYGNESVVEVPSRTKAKTHYVLLRGIPVREKDASNDVKYKAPIGLFVRGSCEYSIFYPGLQKRWRHPEEVMCTHAVAAVELDQLYRETIQTEIQNTLGSIKSRQKKLKTADPETRTKLTQEIEDLEDFLDSHLGSDLYFPDAPITYTPGVEHTALNDVMQRNVTIVDEKTGYERILHEIEREIFHNWFEIYGLPQKGYDLNDRRGSYIHFQDNPYSITFQDLLRLPEQLAREASNAVFKH